MKVRETCASESCLPNACLYEPSNDANALFVVSAVYYKEFACLLLFQEKNKLFTTTTESEAAMSDREALQPTKSSKTPSSLPAAYSVEQNKERSRALNQKLDFALLPLLSLLYLFNGLDRGNVGNAETQGNQHLLAPLHLYVLDRFLTACYQVLPQT